MTKETTKELKAGRRKASKQIAKVHAACLELFCIDYDLRGKGIFIGIGAVAIDLNKVGLKVLDRFDRELDGKG